MQGNKDVVAAREDLEHEANVAATMPPHENLLTPVGLLYEDASLQQLAGIVYPFMPGGDLFSYLK